MKDKIKNISFYIFLALFLGINCHFYIFESFDEIWKYQFSKALTMGYIPYKDINMMITPLYYILMSLGLNFDSSFLMFRFEEGIFWFIFFVFFCEIFKKYNKNRMFIIFFYALLVLECPSVIIFDYNSLLLLFAIIITYIYFFKENSLKKWFILGLFGGLCDLTKHTIGLLFVFVIFLFCLIENKKDIKMFVSSFIGVFIPNFIFLIYLLVTNTFFTFFDLCLFGLVDFEGGVNSNIWLILMIVLSTFLLIKTFIKFLQTKDLKILFCILISLILLLLNYPIFELGHFYQFFLYSLLFIIFFEENNNSIKHFITNFYTLLISIIVIINTLFIYEQAPFTTFKSFNTIKAITNLEEFSSMSEIIKEEFKDKKVYIISAHSVFYSIYNNEYKGYLDLFVKGNIGSDGHINYIENLDNFNDAYFIINENYEKEMWQNFDDLSNYFKENFKLVDEIKIKKNNSYENFYVYKK